MSPLDEEIQSLILSWHSIVGYIWIWERTECLALEEESLLSSSFHSQPFWCQISSKMLKVWLGFSVHLISLLIFLITYQQWFSQWMFYICFNLSVFSKNCFILAFVWAYFYWRKKKNVMLRYSFLSYYEYLFLPHMSIFFLVLCDNIFFNYLQELTEWLDLG